MIVDRHGRRFRKLRVSLTAACNYACTYCVPDGKRLMRARDELDADELAQAVALLVDEAGIEELRITGGEPLVSPKFGAFLDAVAALPLRDISLTTNGQLLEPHVEHLVAAGVRRINISLDTLDPQRFRELARGGDLATVLAAIEACLAAGLAVKVNMVPVRTGNADQVLPMLDWCLQRGIELRFIELMRMGHLAHSAAWERDFLGMDEVLDAIGTRHTFERTDAAFDSTAVRFAIPDQGSFGVIANTTEPFCANCTRLRLASDGWLYGCLSNTARHPMADLLEMPEAQARPLLRERLGAALGDKQELAFRGEVTVMKLIGG